MQPLQTGFIRAAVEGTTVDGRQITAEYIEQMGNSYNREVYNCRIWKEHLRSFSSDGAFKPLGDVMAAKSAKISSGPLAGKTALYVKLAPSPELITLVRAGEKVHLSVEIDTNFAGTNQAYLTGLGVTDSPASLGTEILKFSQQSQHRGLFSQPLALDQQETGPTFSDTPPTQQKLRFI